MSDITDQIQAGTYADEVNDGLVHVDQLEPLLGELTRLRDSLKLIAVGKTQADNRNPLGADAAMAGRFITIAQAALAASGEEEEHER